MTVMSSSKLGLLKTNLSLRAENISQIVTLNTISNLKTTCNFNVVSFFLIQKRQLGIALVTWVRKVLSDEFEMLHSSFPRREGLLELARLENFLRYTLLGF